MTQSRPTGRIDRDVKTLAELNLSEETLDTILVSVGRIGVDVLEGWDAAGTTLVERNKATTYGRTDERVDKIDQFQYDTESGPCVEALDGQVKYFDGNDIKPAWRRFAEVAGDYDIYSVVSFPLKFNGEVIGALNFYSTQRDALRPGQQQEGNAFAAQAAISLASAKQLHGLGLQVDQLREALQTRTMIGQATGILMAQEALSSDEAFQKLVQISQTSNIKLRDIAQRYVEKWEEHTG